MAERIRFIPIEFDLRDKLGISNAEFILCWVVFYRQNSPGGTGWCYEKREILSSYINITKRHVQNLINNLVNEGLLIEHEETGHLKITDKWYKIIIYGREEIISQVGNNFQESGNNFQNPPVSLLYRKEKKEDKGKALVMPFDGPKFSEAWSNWLSDRKERGKKVTNRAAQMQLKKLSEITQSESEAILIIFQSIERNWQTFYPINNGQQKTGKQNIKGTPDSMANRHKEYAQRFGES